MAITPNGRRALVCLWGAKLALVDLAELLSTPAGSTADLELLAELATAQHIDLGDLSGLTTDQWLERWSLLRERSPHLSLPSPAEKKAAFAAIQRKLSEAQSLLRTGVQAFQQARFEVALEDLQKATSVLRALRHSHPSDPLTVRLHGISLGFLASSLRDLKRPGEALIRARESLSAYESMADPEPGDFFNMACACAMISVLDEQESGEEREKLQKRSVELLRKAIEGDHDRILAVIPADRDLDSLRARSDFRELMADAIFPRDPFARP